MKKLIRLVFVVAWCLWEGSALGAGSDKDASSPGASSGSHYKRPRKKSERAPVDLGGPAEKDSVAKSSAPLSVSNATVVAVLAPEIGMRSFSYNEALFGRLRNYSNGAIAMASVGAELYPFATSGTPFLRDIGLVGRFGQSLKFKSKTDDGTQSANGTWMRYAVGARARIHTSGNPSAVLVGIEATYGDSKFDFTGADPVVQAIPSVDYKYVRGGVDARIPFGAFSLLGGAGFLHVLSAGSFDQKFPRASIEGVDARLGGALAVAPSIEVRAGAEYTRVFSTANPRPGDVFVAGGALDQYLVFNVGLSAFF